MATINRKQIRQRIHTRIRRKVRGTAEQPGQAVQTLPIDARWKAVVTYGVPQFWFQGEPPGNPEPIGGALVVQLGPDEFLVTGMHARVNLVANDPAVADRQIYEYVDEGTYEDGQWVFRRRWNGDQTDYGLNFSDAVQLLRVTLATYRTTHDVDRGAQTP